MYRRLKNQYILHTLQLDIMDNNTMLGLYIVGSCYVLFM